MRLLDGARGTGYGSNTLGEVAREVIGTYCSADAFSYASATYGKSHVSLRKSLFESTPLLPDPSTLYNFASGDYRIRRADAKASDPFSLPSRLTFNSETH
jgi:hypothetical protein